MDQDDENQGAGSSSSGAPDINDLMNAFNCLGTDNKEDLVAQFKSLVPNLRSNYAEFYLEANNWNLQLALNAFMDTQSVSTVVQTLGRVLDDLDENVEDQSGIQENTLENVLELLNQLPSGQIAVPPNVIFQLAWQLRNIGPGAWPIGSQIIWTGGTFMGKEQAYCFQSEVQPGQIVEIAFELKSPPNPGMFQATWHLGTPDGKFYGQQITNEFNIIGSIAGDGLAQTQNASTNAGPWMANSSGDNQSSIPNSGHNDNEDEMF